MFALIKIALSKLAAAGSSGLALQLSAMVVLQASSSAIQTKMTSEGVRASRQEIVQQRESVTDAYAPDFIRPTDDGYKIGEEYYESAELDAPLIALDDAPFEIQRAPASASVARASVPSTAPAKAPALDRIPEAASQGSEASAPSSSSPAAASALPSAPAPAAPAPAKAPAAPAPAVAYATPIAVPAPAAASAPSPKAASSDTKAPQAAEELPPVQDDEDTSSGDDEDGDEGTSASPQLVDTQVKVHESDDDDEEETSRLRLQNVANQASKLYVAVISYEHDENFVSNLSGLGSASWTKLASQCSNRGDQVTEVWWAIGDGAAPEDLVVDLAGQTEHLQAIVTVWDNVDPDDPIRALQTANTLGAGADADCGGAGLNSNTISFSADTSTDNSIVLAAAGFTKENSHLNFNGWTEIAEIDSGSGNQGLNLAVGHKVQETAGSAVVEASISAAVRWSAIAVEIRPRP